MDFALYCSHTAVLKNSSILLTVMERQNRDSLLSDLLYYGNRLCPQHLLLAVEEAHDSDGNRYLKPSIWHTGSNTCNISWRVKRLASKSYPVSTRIGSHLEREFKAREIHLPDPIFFRPGISRLLEMIDYPMSFCGTEGSLGTAH